MSAGFNEGSEHGSRRANEANATGISGFVVYDPPALLPRVVKRWWIVGLATLVAAVAAFIFSSAQTALYRADAQVELSQGLASVVLGANVLQQGDEERVFSTEAEVIRSQRVKDRAVNDFGRELPDVEVTQASSTSDLVSISVSDPDADLAASAANAYLDAYIAVTTADARNQLEPALDQFESTSAGLDDQIAAVQAQLDGLPPRQASSPTATALQGQITSLLAQRQSAQESIDRLQGALSLGSVGVQTFAKATVPDEPVSPVTRRNVALAAALVALGAALISACIPLRRPRRPE